MTTAILHDTDLLVNNTLNCSLLSKYFNEYNPIEHLSFSISDIATVAIFLKSNSLLTPLLYSLKNKHCSIILCDSSDLNSLKHKIIENASIIITDVSLEHTDLTYSIAEKIDFLSHIIYIYVQSDVTTALEPDTFSFFTSGTSNSMPSIVTYTKECIMRKAECEKQILSLGPNDYMLCILPTYHCYGFGHGCIAPALSGCRVTYFPAYTLPTRIMKELASDQYTILITTPFYYNLIYQGLHHLSHLRLMVSSGGPLSQTVINSDLKISNCYGTTETGLIAFKSSFSDTNKTSVGTIIPDVKLTFGNQVDINCNSHQPYYELYVESPYLAKRITTGNSIINIASKLKLNDYGYVDSEGNLYICGRLDNVININGEKVSLDEIEAFLNNHPNIKEVKVSKKTDEIHHEYPIAYVMLYNNNSDSPESLRKYCLERIPIFKIPHEFIIVDHLKRTSTNKIRAVQD